MESISKGFKETLLLDGKEVASVRIEVYSHKKLFSKQKVESHIYSTNGCDMKITITDPRYDKRIHELARGDGE